MATKYVIRARYVQPSGIGWLTRGDHVGHAPGRLVLPGHRQGPDDHHLHLPGVQAMKTEEIKVGATYLTRMGSELAPVVVVGEARRNFNYSLAKETGPRRFNVRRVNETRTLPKSRTAATLRPVPGRSFTMPDGTKVKAIRSYIDSYHVEVGDEKLRALQADPKHAPRNYRVEVDGQDPVLVACCDGGLAATYAVQGLMAQAVFGG